MFKNYLACFIFILDLFRRTHDTSTKRDCLYYLAMANTRAKVCYNDTITL